MNQFWNSWRATEVEELQKKGHEGNSYSTFRFDPYELNWQTKCSKLAAKHYEISRFHLDTWNRYLKLGFVWSHFPWNAISNLQLRPSDKAFRSELVFPSASTLSNICQREYSLTVDEIVKQLPSWNEVCVTFDGCTSTNKLATLSVISYYTDRNWALREVQRTLHEVDSLLFSLFES